MNTNPEMSTPTVTTPAGRELDLFAFVLLLLRNLWLILAFGFVAFLAMAVKMVRTKARYASTAVMVIPQGNVTAQNLAAQLSLSTLDMLGGGFELYGDILRSRVVADQIIRDYNLEQAYGINDLAFTEQTLAALTTVETQHEGLIRVTVQDTDSNRAADIANDYLRQLDNLNRQLVLNNVSQQRAYLEQEMYAEKNRLADAEVALQEIQEHSNGLAPETQANASINQLTTARAQLSSAKIRLASLLTGDTEQNPEVVRVRSEISSLTGQIDELQRGQASTVNGTPTSQVPAQELEYVRRKREVTFHETLFDLLEKQFEAAKQEESKQPNIVQVLDSAVPSHHKAWPPRTYYCMLAGIVGLVAGGFFVGLREVIRAYMRNPLNASRLKQLKAFGRRS